VLSRSVSVPEGGPLSILDIGSGVGRLAIGLQKHPRDDFTYIGIDPDAQPIAWANEHLADEQEQYQFIHLDLHNARYNPHGEVRMDDEFRLPVADGSQDVIYLYSVFTHLVEPEARIYLREFSRLLRDSLSFVFLTVHAESDVQAAQINPAGYPPWPWYVGKNLGPLHRVRYDRKYFEEMVTEAGLKVIRMGHLDEWNYQSGFYLGLA
jgi:SAM-dependent methyltransferase